MFILDWLKNAVSWILIQFHTLFTNLGMNPDSGWTWAFSIVGLVIVIGLYLWLTRRIMQIHADGIGRAVRQGPGQSLKDRAFTVMAEMFLMQHSCHWFCRSKTIASARMLAQHKTRYEQALQAVTPETRQAYLAAINGPALG